MVALHSIERCRRAKPKLHCSDLLCICWTSLATNCATCCRLAVQRVVQLLVVYSTFTTSRRSEA